MNTETIAAIVIGSVAGWIVGKFLRRVRQAPANDTREKALIRDLADACDRLNALRRNAYLTDTDGVRRHYSKVSADVRERAETV